MDRMTVGYEEPELQMFKNNELPVCVEQIQSMNVSEVRLMDEEESAESEQKKSAPPLPSEHVHDIKLALVSITDEDESVTEKTAPFP